VTAVDNHPVCLETLQRIAKEMMLEVEVVCELAHTYLLGGHSYDTIIAANLFQFYLPDEIRDMIHTMKGMTHL